MFKRIYIETDNLTLIDILCSVVMINRMKYILCIVYGGCATCRFCVVFMISLETQ